MKKTLMLAILLASTSMASAADLARSYTKAPPYATVPADAWNGFYAGLSAGYAAGDVSVLDTNGGVAAGPFGYSNKGGTGGMQAGYNYHFSNYLVGLEGDLGYMGLTGQGRIASAANPFHQDLITQSGFYGDVTARLGVTFGSWLLYAKGGYAYFDGASSQTTTRPGYVTTDTGGRNGYTVGAGVEYMVSQNWSVKAEYAYYDFGSASAAQTNVGDRTSPIGFVFTNSESLKFNTAKVGVNYHF